MQKCLSLALSLSLMAPAHLLYAAPPAPDMAKEFWHLYMAQVVSYQPNKVGRQVFLESFGLKSNENPGTEFFSNAMKVKTWPDISIDGDALVIEQKGSKTVKIEMGKPGTMIINGKELALNLKMPIEEQIRKFFQKENTKAAQFPTFYFLPEAQAQSVGDVVLDTAIVGGVSYGAIYMTALVTWGGTGAALGAVAGTGITATGAAVVCGAAVLAGAVKGDTMGQRFLNCASKPLSWMDMNPRDRLYLKNLDCGSDTISVSLKASTGKEERRVFQKSGGSLKSIQLTGESNTVTLFTSADQKRIENGETQTGRQLSRPANSKMLDEAQTLLRDYEFYSRACSDPARRNALMGAR